MITYNNIGQQIISMQKQGYTRARILDALNITVKQYEYQLKKARAEIAHQFTKAERHA